MEGKIKFCYNCGQKLPIEANFCMNCGKKQPPITFDSNNENQENDYVVENKPINHVAYQQEVVHVKKSKKEGALLSKILDTISRSLVFALSILMMAFAFLPNVTMTYDDCDVAHVSTVDAIGFMFDSFYSLTEEELEASDLYKDFLKAQKDLAKINVDDLDDLTNSQKNTLHKFIHLTLRVALRSELANPTIDLILCGVFSILYLAFA